MGNRTFVEKNYSLIKGLVRLYPTIKMTASTTVPVLQKRTFTASGTGSVTAGSSVAAAPTTGTPGWVIGDGFGTRSVARTGTGAWTLTLSDAYLYLVGFSVAQFASATGIAVALGVGVVSGSTNVTTNTAPGNGGVIALQLFDESGAADPGSIGDTYTFEIILANAGEP